MRRSSASLMTSKPASREAGTGSGDHWPTFSSPNSSSEGSASASGSAATGTAGSAFGLPGSSSCTSVHCCEQSPKLSYREQAPAEILPKLLV